MEVSTYSLYAIPRKAVADLQARLAKAETEVSTNERADPVENLGSQIGLYQSLQRQSASLENIRSSNAITESMLGVSQDALTQIAADAQTFVNAVLTAQTSGDVDVLPAQAQSLLASLTSLLNSSAGGAYVFGGVNSAVKPVADYSQGAQAATASAFQAAFGFYQSDPQVGAIAGAAMRSFLTGSFANLFQGASWASNWSQASSTRTSTLISPSDVVMTSVTANESPFQQLAYAYTSIADLGIGKLGAPAREEVLSHALSAAGFAQQGIAALQTTLGLSQTQIKNANSRMQTQASLLGNWVSELGGVDPYEAASTLTNLTTQLETAYALTNRISRLSLVNYIRA